MKRAWIPAGASYPVGSRPLVAISLIAINVAIYLLTSYRSNFLSIDSDVLWNYGYIPAYMSISPYEAFMRLFTSMFLHADPLHIFFNMYFLYFFGKGVEGVLGSSRFLLLYIASGLWAVFLHTASVGFQGVSSISIPAVGASGAISGVLGSFLMLYPASHLSMCFFYIVFPVCGTFRASTFLLFWFAIQVIYGYLRLGGVAFFAHAGGFIAGIAFTWLLGSGIIRGYRYGAMWPGFLGFGAPYGAGLGAVQKAVLSALLLSILAAGLYSYVQASSIDRSSLTYLVEVKVMDRPEGDLYSMSQATLVVSREAPGFTMSPIADDLSRILINRLVASGILFNPQMGGRVDTINASYGVEVQGVRVPFTISARVNYDSNGVLTLSEGSSYTRAVVCDVTCRPGDFLAYPWFTLRSYGPISLSELSQLPLILSAAVTLLSLYVVLAKDRELSIDTT